MSQPADLRAEIATLFGKARAEIDQAERRALALLAQAGGRAHDAAATSTEGWQAAWGKVGDAQKLLQCSRMTALNKIKQHGFGHVVDRRWRVDLNRIR
ncbi:MAG: hypothetical protein Q8K85_11830, partial [Hyphomicrobium sp.]|nr:hypothetical protein [Hyphomicrobium sp.]